MKVVIFIVLVSLLALTCGVSIPQRTGHKKLHMLLEKKCTYGPSYWCQNLINAADCSATKHCIQTVWIHKQYPEDTTSICDTCKELVKQARDQLSSNKIQELIKEVFESSCALLRIKPIVEECDKIADEYIPDLIETLASEMDLQTVCAVAGFCNNAKVHQLLAEAEGQVANRPSEIAPRNRCHDCNTVLELVVETFNSMSSGDFLEYLWEVCGHFSSFSDACSNIVFRYFSNIYPFLKENFNAGDFCLLSGECNANFHKHDIEITPMSKIGYVPVIGENDDLPCELCKQLVTQLREVLVAKTTEAEFKQALQGICKQTKQSFRRECFIIVNRYYGQIYQFLVAELNPTAACQLISICPKNTEVMQPKPETAILSAQEMQLPIDLLVPPHQQVYNQQFCVFCEYFLHYVQKSITDPRVEDEVRKVVDEACSKLPKSINDTCVEFVNTYEPALVAVLAQEIDPSQICPLIKTCSFKCPLCVYTVTKIEKLITYNSKANIKKALDEVCNFLPVYLKPECTDLVNTYADEIIEMLVVDFKPKDVCVFLKFCSDTTPVAEVEFPVNEYYGGDTETYMIYDDTINEHPVEAAGGKMCILCEFVMKEIDDQLKDKATDDEIKKVVRKVCDMMPGTIKDECNTFLNQYGDAIIILLHEVLEPSSICSYMNLCKRQQHPLEFVRDLESDFSEVDDSDADKAKSTITIIDENDKVLSSDDEI